MPNSPVSHADHLVVTAPTLAAGVAYIEQTLGVSPQPGGEHVRMGTHNALLKLGHGFYLEVIAINPAAPAPERARWFGLDYLTAGSKPRLATWVVRTDDIEAAVAAASAAGISPGPIEDMSRGALQWKVTIPADGRPLMDGVMPSLIQWHTSSHPTDNMSNQGCAVVRLEGFHPQAEAIALSLKQIGLQSHVAMHRPAEGQAPHLLALIQTPTGMHPLGLST
ncbi:VOC family protein [Herbaspirillum sp. RV1423]|uniref:VOC family protein n=1 Tax=Herbaspirillum sp. RV1423 TaxID=1443993 RepID=UPI0004B258A4|nr:VOC family protein [Herbaspirillum sp. RV1423]